KELSARYQLTGGVDLRSLLLIPGVLRAEVQTLDSQSVWPTLEKALRQAVEQLIAMRTREGVDLRTDLSARGSNISAAVEKIRQLHPEVLERYRTALHERVRKAGAELELDDERLAREVVLFADRSDISEELTRLQSHLGQFSENLTRSEPIGRTLEFIVQEIGRELNTLGAKANDVAISQIIVTCKSEMEKIREQVQNIE
ncbi:MAG TPA: YicC/YloC family endoribonuclease, partial [Chthoniobacterales bacterium]